MANNISMMKHLLGPVCLGFNGHAYITRDNKPDKDLGRLFEALPKNRARLLLSLASKRSNSYFLFTLATVQEALEIEAANVNKNVFNKVRALSYFLRLYDDGDTRLNPSGYLLRISTDLAQVNQLPKIKPICKRLRVLAQLIEIGPVTKTFVKKEVRQVMTDLVHLITP
jgi:hypothetical protein